MKIEKEIYVCALEHIIEHGDTDIFPYPFELRFINDRKEAISDELSNLDVSKYHPMSLIESLVPKGRYGFRLAHQPYPVDTIIYLALVLRIFDSVEAGRDPIDKNRAFSYRKLPGLVPNFFHEERNYRDWLDHMRSFVFSNEYSHVVRTDISDFYSRIYRHRLENILESFSRDIQRVKTIERMISEWRSKQSFGVPVGSNASRLLAEAALNDTDMAILSEGFEFTRYVDDIVLFVKHGQDPYGALAFLAKHLSENEGLSLNNQKTRILKWEDFLGSLEPLSLKTSQERRRLQLKNYSGRHMEMTP